MDQKGAEPGAELVLDNRKLILGFLLLILVCGGFFVIGFMEGKRQAQARIEPTPANASAQLAPMTAASDSKAPDKGTAAGPITDRSVREQLDWYKNLQNAPPDSRKSVADAESGKTAPAADAKLPPPSKFQADKTAGPATRTAALPAAKVTYTVQLGAFRQRREAENKAELLKAKGFVCVIEPPKSGDQLYLVKMGKFESLADAVAIPRAHRHFRPELRASRRD